VTAAQLEPSRTDTFPVPGLRAELQVASVASGLLMLLDAHRLTGRLPLEIQVQVGRLRHAVKVAIQAQAGRPIPMPGPAGVDPAAALRSWIAAQPWAQPGPQGWVYLLCFRDPAEESSNPVDGRCSPDHAASSNLAVRLDHLLVGLCAGWDSAGAYHSGCCLIQVATAARSIGPLVSTSRTGPSRPSGPTPPSSAALSCASST
jgi:hypothetical protein